MFCESQITQQQDDTATKTSNLDVNLLLHSKHYIIIGDKIIETVENDSEV